MMGSKQSMSDKALIYIAKEGDSEAIDVLAKRFGVALADKPAVQEAIKRLSIVSVNATRRIMVAHSGIA